MREPIQHFIQPASGIERIARTFRAPARRWLCAGLLLTLAPLCKAQPADVQLPGNTDPNPQSSGPRVVSATHSITAAGANGPMTINGTAQVIFHAGSQINLEPGFTATAASGSTGILFHAVIAPLITVSSLPSGALGSAYSQTLTASGGIGPYTWSFVSGWLPPGLALSAGGVISGTPAAPGTYTFTVMVTGSDGAWYTSQLTITIPGDPSEALRTGVRPTGAYWGAAGEQIDLWSGNLNFTVPLLKPQSRGGWSASFALSYNSQMWRQEAGGSAKLSRDVGYGLGWTLQAGSVTPVPLNGTVQSYLFTDATGAEYQLTSAGSGVYASRDGIYVWYDSGAQQLRFPDGSWWDMLAQSAAQEPDAGTLYPTAVHDTNGNSIVITYLIGAGGTALNTSARIRTIMDSRGRCTWCGEPATYQFSYTAGASPHLTSITGPMGENYQFTMASGQTVSAPPNWPAADGTATLLQEVVNYGLWTKHQFTYNGSAEMTKMVTPLGGDLRWDYRTYTYTGTGRSYREVTTRRMTPAWGGAQANWSLTPADGATMHGSTTVSDMGANSSKVWTFDANGATRGLATSYEERGPGGVALVHTDYGWSTSNGNVYLGTVVNTRNPGASPVQSASAQALDGNGNITASAVYDYGNLTTPAKTYNYTYLTDVNYTSRYIRNRVVQATMTPAGGTTTTLVTNWYDTQRSGFLNCGAMVSRTGAAQHDDTNYGTGMVYRGNVYWKNSLESVSCYKYETTGVVTMWSDGAGHSVTSAPSADTSYALPGALTPGGNANLATSVTYASSWAVTSVTGPNGASGTTTYDGYGRPYTTTIPDGAVTNYAYTYVGVNGSANQQTATLTTGTATRWKRTTLDGFGRVTRVENGNGPATNPPVSQVDTEYAPCACSPLGKVSQVSMPYAPGGTRVWTTYGYDGSGRTVSVTSPDGSVTTTEYLTVYGSYTGSLVRVTEPHPAGVAGRWKIQQTNGLGQLVRAMEPNPAGGAVWITNYTYDALGHLVGVSMPRDNGTQTRTFVYTGSDLTSATNPENGTVTYQYDGSHRVTKRTDAKGQETRYTYDAYGRLTVVQHWAVSWDNDTQTIDMHEYTKQRVTYSYDTNPLNESYTQNGWGRLTAVQYQDENTGEPFSYMYSYSVSGRVTAQHMNYNGNAVSFNAAYTWDTEGRMTAIDYGNAQHPQQFTMQYDANGRLGGMQEGAVADPLAVSASYGVAGEMLGLAYQGPYRDGYGQETWYSETRTYNTLLQLTRQTGTAGISGPLGSGTMMDTQYVYAAGANNGRIAQSIDGVGGETVNYTYDALNRLATAGATNGTWGQRFTYDGFGNLTGKAVTAGSAPTLGVSVDPATNRVVGQSYDANGNVGGGYDVENRMIAGPDYGTTHVYDHAGKRVKKASGTSWELYFYGIGGQKLVTQACTSSGCTAAPQYNVYFGGKLVKSKGVLVVTDRLGSVRASGYERMSYYPYGEEKTSTADGREKFGTYTRDNPATDYADQRYYGVGSGRFNSPDPSSGVDPSEPGTWNKYAYVVGDPVNFVDRNGLFYSQADLAGNDEEDQDQPILGPNCFGPKTPTNPKPSRAVVRLNKAQATLSNRISFSVDCLNDIESIAAQRDQSMRSELSINSLIDAAVAASFKNGVGSTDPTSSLYLDPTAAAAVGAGTIGASFAANPNGLTAKSQLGTNTAVGTIIYINPTLISNSLATNEALLLHESLHLLGFDDADLQRGLGLPVDDHNTKGISTKLQKDCVTRKGNDRW